MQLSKPCSALVSPCSLFTTTTHLYLPIYLYHQRCRRDHYATHASSDENHIPWPSSAKARITPYDIFDIKKGGPYSKQTFYHLVKMYHPDRTPQAHQLGLGKADRMERFRLVVAANDILCDPVKKSAYDRYGAGWSGMAEVRMKEGRRAWTKAKPKKEPEKTRWAKWADSFSHKHSNFDESPAGNATWEDWERWYRRDDPIPRTPLTTNSNFITFVVLFAFIGGLMQVNRLDTNAISLVEGRERQHMKLSRDMSRIEREVVLSSSRQERIQAFMQTRDPQSHVPLAGESKPLSLPLPKDLDQ